MKKCIIAFVVSFLLVTILVQHLSPRCYFCGKAMDGNRSEFVVKLGDSWYYWNNRDGGWNRIVYSGTHSTFRDWWMNHTTDLAWPWCHRRCGSLGD